MSHTEWGHTVSSEVVAENMVPGPRPVLLGPGLLDGHGSDPWEMSTFQSNTCGQASV